MKNKLIFPLMFVVFGAACGGDDEARRAQNGGYEVVQEGSASGVTSSIQGPGETLPPITGTNADTTTAFSIDPNAAQAAPAPGGTLAGTLPPPSASSPVTSPYGGSSPSYRPPEPQPMTSSSSRSYEPPRQQPVTRSQEPSRTYEPSQPRQSQPQQQPTEPPPSDTTSTQQQQPPQQQPPANTTTRPPQQQQPQQQQPPQPQEEPADDEEEAAPPPTATDTRGN